MNIIVTDSVLKIDKSNNKCSEVLDTSALMREHPRVFNESLGRHVSARAMLRVRPDAQPVFRRARPLPLALRAPVDAELERMERADIPATAAGRLIRWALLLSGYQYDIEYVKSADNIADGLSRLPLPLVDQSDASDDCSFVQFIENNFPIRALDVKRETAADKALNVVLQYVKSGWPKTGVVTDLLPYYRRRDELNIEGGCLIWGSRVVVPAALQAAVLAEVHGGHLGIVKCKSIARSYVWWPRIDLDIEQLCNSCRVCAETADAPPRTEEGMISRHTNQLRARHDYGTAPTDEPSHRREARNDGVTPDVHVAPLAATGSPAPATSPRPMRAHMPVTRYGFEDVYP
ncbi:uncharacterized protein LOC134748525 [Cydia strobilella]|uniref:uncharacterized protein LOC134748525 n=1 Tax=Cydia strobilella TaxID=1100964 RepID=UPI0030054D28